VTLVFFFQETEKVIVVVHQTIAGNFKRHFLMKLLKDMEKGLKISGVSKKRISTIATTNNMEKTIYFSKGWWLSALYIRRTTLLHTTAQGGFLVL
jgi:hypothetical protein